MSANSAVLVEATVDLCAGEAGDGAVQEDIFAAGELRVEAGAEFGERGRRGGSPSIEPEEERRCRR